MRYLILVLALCLTASAQPIFGGGGGASIFKPRGATLPASCTTDGLVYVLTADDGGNARGSYVCLNGTYASMTAASAGTGDVVGTTGAGAPSANCTAGKAVYYDTTGEEWYVCGPTANTWRRVLTSDDTAAGLLTLNELAANGSNFRAFSVPDALTASLTFALPNSVPAAGQVMAFSAPSSDISTISWVSPITANQKLGAVGITIDGGGSAITTGLKGCVPVEYAGLITQATALADQSGSIVVDIWKDTYANYPPTDADSITASAPVTISTATKSQDATLTGWDTGKTIAAGDVVCFNVDSATTVTRVTVSLKITKD